MKITPIPALQDNYIWSLTYGKQCIIIDPGAYQPVANFLTQNHLNLQAILLTHSHHDHIGGVAELKHHYNPIVYGTAAIAKLTTEIVSHNDQFQLPGWEQDCTVFACPGHTNDHIAYLFDNEHLFIGDTLFSGGCGRVFTGTINQLFNAIQWLKTLNNETIVYPAHEYTQANLNFALTVLPKNHAIQTHLDHVNNLMNTNTPTLPTTIGLEKQINVFLQTDNQEVHRAVNKYYATNTTDELAIFTGLRKWKDLF